MARPYVNVPTSDNNGSLMSPMSTGSNTPISYRANVNRQKTKKWAEAKKIDYGGDDWGDDDEYADYGYEPEPAPAPVSKPTGFRQQGQGLYGAREQPVDQSKKSYGSLPSASGGRAFNRPRANSFEADDEKRHFSNSAVTSQQQSPPPVEPPSTSAPKAGPATRFSHIIGGIRHTRDPSGPPSLSITTQPPPVTGLRKPSLPHPPPQAQPSYSDVPQTTQPSRTNDPSGPSTGTANKLGDFDDSRDFSPSAVPAPLSMRGAQAPESAAATPAAKFPVRKSSLSIMRGDAPRADRTGQDSPGAQQWVTHSNRSVSAAATAPSGTAPGASNKALPFIRPADIYRRAEEERRASLDSGRPSMESLGVGQSSDRSPSPGQGVVRERSSSESLGRGNWRGPSFGDEASDAGRRLVPILEPVKERRSEYGFEGFNADNIPSADREISHAPLASQLDINNARRQSTSPKLPNLHRISGFGSDLFSQSRPEYEHQPEPEQTKEPVTEDVQAPEEATLRTQPSFGFRSVVNQAFDRRTDNSVPPTPASQTGSDIKRTDSESTGTAGISPIMSRLPSSAVQDSRGRETSTPNIMEVVEPNTPTQAAHSRDLAQEQEEPLPPSFIPGHRREMSAPSPGNSPARTPDIARAKRISMGEHAWISSTSLPDSPLDGEVVEDVEPTRPAIERDESFRPQLPGGWQSYATTATDITVQQDSPRAQTPERQREEVGDLTPTTAKHQLPQSSLEAAAIVLGVNTGSLPTPDPSMAPSGNLYSAMVPDPRLAPTLERVSPENQLRADVPIESSSEESLPPPLPPKDYPGELKDSTSADVAAESSLPALPPKDYPTELTDNTIANVAAQTSLPAFEEAASDPDVAAQISLPAFEEAAPDPDIAAQISLPAFEEAAPDPDIAAHISLPAFEEAAPDPDIAADVPLPPERVNTTTTLSTDEHASDEENDRLRKEIVKSLTPQPPENDPTEDSSFDRPYSLADVYDNYWIDEGNTSPLANSAMPEPVQQAMLDPDIPEIRPLSSHRMSQPLLRPALATRFSWEKSTENIPETVAEAEQPRSEVEPAIETAEEQHENLPEANQHPEPYLEKMVVEDTPPENHHHERDAALLAGGAFLGASAAGTALHSASVESPPTVNVLLTGDTNNLQPRGPSPQVSPPADDRDAVYDSFLKFNADPLKSNPHSPASTPSIPNTEPSPAPRMPATPAPMAKILSFKEIMAIQDPKQRVHAFNETKERFAAMDSGIHEWILATQAQYPEHADVTASYAGYGSNFTSGTVRSKHTKSVGPGMLQAPYYQQYLNASSPSQSTPMSRPGPNTPVGTQQGFSPAGAKITTQQVQAKGKEFLHSAGVFGGKAGKAGKGLLAKGKSRLRAAGGGDKTSPPPKQRNPNRSSWSLGLNLSRPAVRADPSIRYAEQHSPTEPADTRISASDLLTSTGKVPGPTTEKRPKLEQDAASREPESEILVSNATEEQASVNVPAPISKSQPTWDPYNATPIAEEVGYSFEDQPEQRLTAAQPTSQTLGVPAEQSESTRSNSYDAADFYDAQEEQSVEPEPALNSPPAMDNTTRFASRVEEANKPQPSIMNRPRGSFDYPNLTTPQVSQPTIRAVPNASYVTPVTQATPQRVVAVEEQGRQPSFKVLPPIRRTSTFGFEFGSRKPQTRFPISDDEDDEDANVGEYQTIDQGMGQGNDGTTIANERHELPAEQRGRLQPAFDMQTKGPSELDSHRAGPANIVSGPTHDPRIMNSAQARRASMDHPFTRFSFEQQLSGQPSNTNQPFSRNNIGPQRTIPNPPYEQPPSSAERYPELFGGGPTDDYTPRGYYQAPIGRAEAFLPRQQTSEYELPGVGPPRQSMDESAGRRRGSFDRFREGIGKFAARATSRERRGSVAHEPPQPQPQPQLQSTPSPRRRSTAGARDEAALKRGSGFWGTFDIAAEAQPSNSPLGKESMVAHYSGSQSNLQASPGASPQTPKSLFNPNLAASSSPQPQRLNRAATEMMKSEKKKKLSGFGSLFSRGGPSVLAKKRATVDFSQYTTRTGNGTATGSSPSSASGKQGEYTRRPSQQLNFLSRFTNSSTSIPKSQTQAGPQIQNEQAERPRRPSVGGILNGMLRKRSNTLENESQRGEGEGRRQGVLVVPSARMYSDLQGGEEGEGLGMGVGEVKPVHRLRKAEGIGRGRKGSLVEQFVRQGEGLGERVDLGQGVLESGTGIKEPKIEPRYDPVPIPDGYSRVQGEGQRDEQGYYPDRRPSHATQFSVPSPVSPLVMQHSPLPQGGRAMESEGWVVARERVGEVGEGGQQQQQRPWVVVLPSSGSGSEEGGGGERGETTSASTTESDIPPPVPLKDERFLGSVRTREAGIGKEEKWERRARARGGETQTESESVDVDAFPLPPSPERGGRVSGGGEGDGGYLNVRGFNHTSSGGGRRESAISNENHGLQRSKSEATSVSALSRVSDERGAEVGRYDGAGMGTGYEGIGRESGYERHRESLDLYDASPIVPKVVQPGSEVWQRHHFPSRVDTVVVGERGDAHAHTQLRGAGGLSEGQGGRPRLEVDTGEGVGVSNTRGGGRGLGDNRGVGERVQMSATSYPGMEWNPYMGGDD
ncbi:SWI-SNF chromatin-remodeling complex protein [Rutstroemia sp. NJR-2017a BBW]|nr:SWI-SNF chromatin-remodeling complex protein [Rutstroemia sp. NJR-2017a BBW]